MVRQVNSVTVTDRRAAPPAESMRGAVRLASVSKVFGRGSSAVRALDAMTRDVLHDELDRICADRRLTVLFVTHNVREAVRLGDRVVVLSSRPGRVIADYPVPIQRPRRIDSAPVAELAGTITDRLREEVSRHGK